MRSARFLLGVLADHFERAEKDDARQESFWRERMSGLQETLPAPAARSPEQWEELVNLTGELYYALAAHTNSRAAAEHLARLRDAADRTEDR